jgi:dynein light intermediate chain 1
VHSGLGIQSLAGGKKETGNAYEVSRREGTLVPMNWDSWAKIRMMADNFDPEDISKTWSEDIRLPTPETSSETVSPTSVTTYESLITNPKSTAAKPAQPSGTIEIDSKPVQDFLGEQSKILEEFQIGDRKERVAQDAKKDANRSQQSLLVGDESNRHVEEHIGPVQFNVGGIQVDAEEMVRGIKDREATRSGADDLSRREREVKSPGAKAGGGGESAEVENQRLKDFFTNLAKKSGGSAVNSPRRGVGGE